MNQIKPINLRRLGCVKYTHMFVEEGSAQLLYESFVPLDLRHDAAEDMYYAKGVCSAFREVPIGEQIPSYRATITRLLKNGHDSSMGFNYHLTFEELIEDLALKDR